MLRALFEWRGSYIHVHQTFWKVDERLLLQFTLSSYMQVKHVSTSNWVLICLVCLVIAFYYHSFCYWCVPKILWDKVNSNLHLFIFSVKGCLCASLPKTKSHVPHLSARKVGGTCCCGVRGNAGWRGRNGNLLMQKSAIEWTRLKWNVGLSELLVWFISWGGAQKQNLFTFRVLNSMSLYVFIVEKCFHHFRSPNSGEWKCYTYVWKLTNSSQSMLLVYWKEVSFSFYYQ